MNFFNLDHQPFVESDSDLSLSDLSLPHKGLAPFSVHICVSFTPKWNLQDCVWGKSLRLLKIENFRYSEKNTQKNTQKKTHIILW